jgi:hypothetical protein
MSETPTPPTLEQRADTLLGAFQCLPFHESRALILSALQDVRAETMAEKNAGLRDVQPKSQSLGSAPTAASVIREALESARPYVEAYCGAKGISAGMAEATVKRIEEACRVLEDHDMYEEADKLKRVTNR